MAYPTGGKRSPESVAKMTASIRARLSDPAARAKQAANFGQGTLRHGQARTLFKTSEYIAWKRARSVCSNPRHPKWDRYGGRGIECRFDTFEAFFAELGPKPGPEYSLDRIDNDGHYEPGNVRWTTAGTQANNRAPRRFTRAAYEALEAEVAQLRVRIAELEAGRR